MKRFILMVALLLGLAVPGIAIAQDRATTLRVVVHANLQILIRSGPPPSSPIATPI